jgi:RND family efflux transporter MFP subunit
VLIGVPIIAWVGLRELSVPSDDDGPMTHTVKREAFVHDISERGNIESASNVEIRCEVESHGAGTMIIWIIPEGTYVEPDPDWKQEDHPGEDPPDLLVRLDSSSLEDRVMQQQIVCNTSAAAVISAENNLDTAKIALEEYEKGKYEQAKLQIEGRIFEFEEALRKAKDTLVFNKEQLAMGYVTELQVEADEYAVQKAEKDLKERQTELAVLETYTYKKTWGDLDSAIKVAKARLESEEHSHELDKDKLDEVTEQLAKCVIRAPQAGQVVYANITDRRGGSEVIIEEGVLVRERQTIIKLPDSKNMQVEAKINEAKVASVELGMPATIHMESFPDTVMKGTVEKVNEYAEPSGWYSGNVKEYETKVKIDEVPGDIELRPGMTAEVRIRVETLDDVLTVPVQAVFEHGARNYAALRHGEKWEAREVTLGSTNDKVVVVLEGLKEGEEVVMGARLHRDKLDLPEVAEEPEGEDVLSERSRQLQAQGLSPKPRPGQQAGRGRGGAGSPMQFFRSMDTNGDGKVDASEIPAEMKDKLKPVDTNGDGSIELAEYAAAVQKMAGARGRGGPGGPGAARGGPGAKGPPGGGGRRPGGPGNRPGGSGGGQGGRP